MATYFVASGGSNTSPYDTWAKAATSLQTALTAATSSGDIIVIQYNAVPTGDAEVGADVTYTSGANVAVISASNDGGSAYTPTVMGTANWIGNSTTNRSITLSGADHTVFFYGVTFRTAGSTNDTITIANSAGSAHIMEDCYIWNGNSNASGQIAAVGALTSSAHFINTTFRFGATGQRLNIIGNCTLEGCTISSAGSTPTTLLTLGSNGMLIRFVGCDLSIITGTLVPNQGSRVQVEFAQCKLGSGVTVLATQTTNPTLASAEAYVYDCSSGDEHYHLAHYNALGLTTISTSIYANDGAEYNTSGTKHSWQVSGTSLASVSNPYRSPWITVHHEGTSAITPYLECCLSGSPSIPNEENVWSEWLYKGTSGSTKSTLDQTDRGGIFGTSSDQASSSLGASDWTGESVSSAFFKLGPSSSITPAEIGDLCVRVCAAWTSAIYVDPQIRGRS